MWNERYSFLRIELSQICNLNLIPESGMRFYLLRQRASSWPRPGESILFKKFVKSCCGRLNILLYDITIPVYKKREWNGIELKLVGEKIPFI